MAVQKLQSYLPRWSGLSSDTKPGIGVQPDGTTTITAQDLPSGATFLELDTGAFYRFDGSGWMAAEPADPHGELLQAILGQLVALNEAIVEGLA